MALRRRRALLAGALALVVLGAWQWAAEHRAQDRRDLRDLTSVLPWEPGELLVPDAASAEEDAMGWAEPRAFTVVYRAGPETGDGPMIDYTLYDPSGPGEAEYGPWCGAVEVRSCTDLGGGLVEAVTRDTANSDPALALHRDLGDRAVTVTAYDGEADTAFLRDVLEQVHTPTEDELLELLRRDGYRGG
ncbi:hypothetical protein J0910_19880 [Nocardiopsis sp. CNT-189]|uniref:hypothetical protein n=1 Tax=Nocardiopsis oceanisediminis TaxID=2816862 RepID=UPI003B293A88